MAMLAGLGEGLLCAFAVTVANAPAAKPFGTAEREMRGRGRGNARNPRDEGFLFR